MSDRSDGAYEIAGPDGRTRQLSDLLEQLKQAVPNGGTRLDAIATWAEKLRGGAPLQDDLSLMELEL